MSFVVRHAWLQEGKEVPREAAAGLFEPGYRPLHVAGRQEGTDLDVWWLEWVEP